jgi:predicted O-linked N-acetylglucosamine transferase (SPINDLY family)
MNRKQRRMSASRKAATPGVDAKALFAQALEMHRSGQLDQAERLYRRILVIHPDMADCLHLNGLIFYQRGDYGRAVTLIGRAITLNPNFPAYFSNMGISLKNLGKAEAAARCYRNAIRLKPDYPEAYSNLGFALEEIGKPDEAIAACVRAIALKPDYGDPFNNLGNALKAQGRFVPAATAYCHAVTLQPDFLDAYSNLALCRHYDSSMEGADILAAARHYACRAEVGHAERTFPNSREPGRKLRIGYVSGDLVQHAVGYFLSPVLPRHDRSAFEIFCYHNNPRQDAMTAKLRQGADHWRQLETVSDTDAVAMIAADGIDILVDLSGHTAHNRLPLFARRAAPVQISWLGYWGTTGLSRMDYVLSDAVTALPGQEEFFSEKIYRLEHSRFCYGPPSYAPAPSAAPPLLRNGWVTFGSFNNLTKMGPEVVALWASVLRAVPASRSLLKWKSLDEPTTRQAVIFAFAAAGIDASRLELQGVSPHVEMLARYADIDIALDPFPFTGGLTSCEVMWMGVPLVTLPGTGAPSRQTLGFLQCLDLADWAAGSPQAYVDIATSLAADGTVLVKWRQELRPRMAASLLCDGDGFTRRLEAAYRRIWTEQCVKSRGN